MCPFSIRARSAGGENIEPGDGEGAGAAVQSGASGPQLELGVPLCVHHQQGHDKRMCII